MKIYNNKSYDEPKRQYEEEVLVMELEDEVYKLVVHNSLIVILKDKNYLVRNNSRHIRNNWQIITIRGSKVMMN